jgi:hypothetical protein
MHRVWKDARDFGDAQPPQNHDPARIEGLRPFEGDAVLASVKTTPLGGWRWRAKS